MTAKRESDLDSLAWFGGTLGRTSTIQHWQLRDLLHCPDKDGELFCVHRNRTLRYDVNNDRSSVVQELAFEPTSMTVSHGFVAAGGQNSQLDVRSLGTGEVVYKGHCGGSVNNALHIARDASHHLRLFISNNDDTVKVYSLASGTLVTLVRCPVAINYCSLSPSGRYLVCVGDNRHTYLYESTPTGYRQSKVFTEACDAGMCCDWSPSGALFAAVFQDGVAAVWDHRSSRLVAKLQQGSACRNVKFAPAPLDLLAFSEHKGRAHLLDMRVWGQQQQVLEVRQAGELDLDISGLAFAPSGRRLYVGTEEGIAMFEVDTMARRGFPHAELC
ncbi:hypothetical protein N2152v2_005557 [Parachlorella kessleri]